MRLPRRTTVSLLGAIICVNVLARYPFLAHEIGVDTFVFHGMATSLVEHGYAKWIIHPLSYLGLYPLSHPSASPFLAASLANLTGFPLEGTIPLLDTTLATLGVLAAYLLGWEFTHNEVFSLLLGMVFSLTPEMLTSLIWQMPTRIVFTTLLPLFLWGLIRLGKQPNRRHFLITAVIALLMMSFHRLTILLALVAIAYVITGILLTVVKVLRSSRPRFFLNASYTRRVPYVALFAFGAISGGILFLTGILDQYSVGVMATGDSIEVQLLNLAVSLARGSGLLLPLCVVGLVAVARARNKTIKEPFVFVSFLVFIPLLFLRQYTSYYTVPFTALFIAFGLFAILRRENSRRLRLVTVAGATAFIFVSSAAVATYDLHLTPPMSMETYNTALYLRNPSNATVLTNEGLVGSQLHAISGIAYLPVGGATTAFQGPELLMFGFIDPEYVAGNVRQIPLGQLTLDSDSPFDLQGVQAEADWAHILLASVDGIPSQYAHYNVTYVLESRRIEGRYTAYGNFYPSLLLETAHESKYIMYQDVDASVFYVG